MVAQGLSEEASLQGAAIPPERTCPTGNIVDDVTLHSRNGEGSQLGISKVSFTSVHQSTSSEKKGKVNGEVSSSRCCIHEGCLRRPFFGLPGTKPTLCSRHAKKSEGMVDVSSRRCEAAGCTKWPLYGIEGQKAKFCSLHKLVDMIDVRSRRCQSGGCKRQPSYGFEGSKACFCAAHKVDGMVDVVSRRCEKPLCRRRPLYGYEGQKSRFCSNHKAEGMADVCNRRCEAPGCTKRPCFGHPGQRPTFCASHRSPAMLDVITHKCSYPGCKQTPRHEAHGRRAKFCVKHMTDGQAGASLLQLAGAKSDGATANEGLKKASRTGDIFGSSSPFVPSASAPLPCGSPAVVVKVEGAGFKRKLMSTAGQATGTDRLGRIPLHPPDRTSGLFVSANRSPQPPGVILLQDQHQHQQQEDISQPQHGRRAPIAMPPLSPSRALMGGGEHRSSLSMEQHGFHLLPSSSILAGLGEDLYKRPRQDSHEDLGSAFSSLPMSEVSLSINPPTPRQDLDSTGVGREVGANNQMTGLDISGLPRRTAGFGGGDVPSNILEGSLRAGINAALGSIGSEGEGVPSPVQQQGSPEVVEGGMPLVTEGLLSFLGSEQTPSLWSDIMNPSQLSNSSQLGFSQGHTLQNASSEPVYSSLPSRASTGHQRLGGLDMQRRASAFIVNPSALPPVKAEVKRRYSAFAPGGSTPQPRLPHYWELLSALPFKSSNTFAGVNPPTESATNLLFRKDDLGGEDIVDSLVMDPQGDGDQSPLLSDVPSLLDPMASSGSSNGGSGREVTIPTGNSMGMDSPSSHLSESQLSPGMEALTAVVRPPLLRTQSSRRLWATVPATTVFDDAMRERSITHASTLCFDTPVISTSGIGMGTTSSSPLQQASTTGGTGSPWELPIGSAESSEQGLSPQVAQQGAMKTQQQQRGYVLMGGGVQNQSHVGGSMPQLTSARREYVIGGFGGGQVAGQGLVSQEMGQAGGLMQAAHAGQRRVSIVGGMRGLRGGMNDSEEVASQPLVQSGALLLGGVVGGYFPHAPSISNMTNLSLPLNTTGNGGGFMPPPLSIGMKNEIGQSMGGIAAVWDAPPGAT